MSFYTNKTDVTSILKTFSGVKRNQANAVAINKVRFSTPKEKGLAESVRVALEERNFHLVKEFTYFLREAELSDDEVVIIIKDAKRIVHNLTPEFVTVVEALLSLNWKKRSSEIIEAYTEFCIELMVTHNRYLPIGVSKLIVHWIPGDMDESDWVHGCPSEHARNELKPIHKVLDRILTAVPMAFDIIIDAISAKFPYFKKPYHVTAGYLYNVLWLLEYKPIFEELVFQLVLQKILLLDVNAPKDEIELEMNDEEEKVEADTLFEIDDVFAENVSKSEKSVSHPVGKTLDVSLFLLYKFFDGKCRLNENSSEQQRRTANRLFKMLLYLFDEVLLPSHNTHHVQFILFYATSLRSVYSEAFLDSLWTKVQNPNVSAVIRHAAVGYMASFLSRARFLPLSTVIFYLKELTKWAHAYIDDSDAYKQNCSLKANLVFYSVCQAVFYLIAFRARDLTASSKEAEMLMTFVRGALRLASSTENQRTSHNFGFQLAQPAAAPRYILKKDLLFLQSLQLSRLAMCHLNPLRYCLAPVATAFAGVTRTYQLAYCHTVLERNARRKLATVYGHEKCMPDETLESFFPFDPYVLKLSKKYIDSNYMAYQSNDTDEYVYGSNKYGHSRKRGDSEMLEEDEFLIADKRPKNFDLSKSQEFDKQFHFGSSTGFYE